MENSVKSKSLKICNLEECLELEQSSYPPEEGASKQQIQFRLENASHLQDGYFLNEELIGMILATSTTMPKLTAESMKTHEDGQTLCIHSVVVREDKRRKGLATFMLKRYLDRVRRTDGRKFEKCCIIVHQELANLYKAVGFEDKGKSDVQHGNTSWIDMQYNFTEH